LNVPRRDYHGAAPDIDAFEYDLFAAMATPFACAATSELQVLLSNYPNPFNASTRVAYQVPVSGRLTLKLYDGLGRLIRTLVDEETADGVYTVVTWDGRDDQGVEVASGIYFSVLQGKNFCASRKLFLLR
jgi:hypothetical protein